MTNKPTADIHDFRGRLALGMILSAIIAIWGWLLPLLSTTQTIRSRERWLDEKQIDPAAMFYTDLPIPDLVVKAERRQH